jgi:hypothetical protein
MNARMSCALICTASLLCAALESRAGTPTPQFSIDWHVISPGGTQLRSNCFVLDGTLGQPVPGYSSGGIFAVLSGYWSVAPITGTDEIFFNGFEGCSP